MGMNCPRCESTTISKNGRKNGKQRYLCQDCGRQFVACYCLQGYPPEVKRHYLSLDLNGMGFRGMECSTGINHNTVINWVRQVGACLPKAPDAEEIPEVTQVEELQNARRRKKNKVGLWTVVRHCTGRNPSLDWRRYARRASCLGQMAVLRASTLCGYSLRGWESFWYLTDGSPVYQCLISELEHLISKTYMTRVEGENSRLRQTPRPITSKNFLLL